MKNIFLLIFSSVLYYECGGHGRFAGRLSLGGILADVSERVHSGIKDTASIVLGGLNHGVKVEYDGHTNTYNQQPPPPRRPAPNHGGNVETVIVIVEEDTPQHPQTKPTNHNGNQGYANQYNRPINNGYNRPNNGYQQNHGHIPQNNGYNQQNNGYNRPNQGYNQQNNGYNKPNQGQNQQQGQFNQQDNGLNQHNNVYNQPNHVNQYNPSTTTKPYNDNHQPTQVQVTPPNNQGNNEIDRPYNHKPQPLPTTTSATSRPQRFSTEASVSGKTTVKYDPNKPFFVALNPNEYVYGGDHINISAPKRDTDQKKEEETNGEEAIDIRFGDT